MGETATIIHKTSRTATIIVILFLFAFASANAQTNFENTPDSISKDNALENKQSFFNNTDDLNTNLNVDVKSTEKTPERNIIVVDDTQKLKNVTKKQNDSLKKTDDAMLSIERRGNIKVFMVGNRLGVLKYQIVQMKGQSHILREMALGTDDLTIKNQIDDQAKASELQQAKVEDFILKEKSRFSLFGWFIDSI